MATVLLSNRAQRDAASLPPIYLAALDAAIAELAPKPLSGKLLRGKLGGLRSYRVGVYRIVYEFDSRAKAVLIVSVRHRSEAYRRAR